MGFSAGIPSQQTNSYMVQSNKLALGLPPTDAIFAEEHYRQNSRLANYRRRLLAHLELGNAILSADGNPVPYCKIVR